MNDVAGMLLLVLMAFTAPAAIGALVELFRRRRKKRKRRDLGKGFRLRNMR